MKQKKQKKNLFTMMELVIVVAIIALLSALVAPNLLQMFTDAEVAACKADFQTIKTAVTSYRVNKKKMPSSTKELFEAKLIEKDMKDPWGGEYTIEDRDGVVVVSSRGKDGTKPITSIDEN